MYRGIKSQISALCLFLTIVLFQNCAKVQYLSGEKLDFLKTDNNGSNYDGKPKGIFYRFLPDWTCDGKQAPVSSVEISDSDVTLTENLSLQCGRKNSNLDSFLIDSSKYQQEIIGYKEGIFEGLNSVPGSIPTNLVEVWCHEKGDTLQGKGLEIETITRYDRSQSLAVSQIYYFLNGISKKIDDFTVSRLASQTTVTVKDTVGAFDLTVHRDQPSPLRPGLFKGDLKVLIDGKIFSRDLDCRLGGSVDPKVWPARQIVDLDIGNFLFSPDLSAMAWSSSSILNAPKVYTAMINGSQQRPVSPPYLTESFPSLWFTPDSKSVLYTGDRTIQFVRELFKVNLDGSSAIQINEPVTAFNQKVGPSIKVSSDSRKVFYSDGTQIHVPNGPEEPWLRVNSYNGGIPLVLFPQTSMNTQAPPGGCTAKAVVRGFDYSNKYDRVVLLGGGDYCEDIYLVNADGSNLKKVTPSLPSSDWRFDWAAGIMIPPDGDYAVALAQTFSSQFQFYAVPLDGSAAFSITDIFNSIADMRLASGNIFYASNLRSNNQLMNLDTRKSWNVPLLSSPFLSPDNSKLYGISPDEAAVSISTIDGHEESLCGGTDRKVIFLKNHDNDSLLIGFYDSHGLVQIDIRSSTGVCLNIARIPIENLKDVSMIKVASDRKRMLMRVGFPNEDLKSLYYIPFSQQSPLLVNMPLLIGGKVLEAEFSKDSQSIVYYGTQMESGESNVFLWNVPPDLK